MVIFDVHVNQSLVSYKELYDLAEAIDNGPFQTLWVLDHFAALQENVTHPMLDPFVLLGALAAKTTTLQLGILVANVVNRQPAVLAQASTSLQFMSNKRFTLGLGAGASPTSRFAEEHHSLGIELQRKMADRHAHLVHSVQTIRSIWKRDANSTPLIVAPPTEPHITIGVNSSELAVLAAQLNCSINIRWNHENLSSILSAYQKEAKICGTHASASVWMPWSMEHTKNQEAIAPIADLGVDRVIFLTTQQQHFSELMNLGNFLFP
jgi:alkanesulfonate monooxygenase SsuD/methylene tetrahydromethanopterin reductase-like flavin-dependent oxidoreductase (luciferase family)